MKTGAQQKVEEAVWLHYFNAILLENGLIQEEEWRKMNWRIGKEG